MSRVLLVDEDADNRRICATFLELAGYDVEVAATAAHALDIAIGRTIDVVVADVGIHGTDDLEWWRLIRQSSGQPRPVLIGLTALEPTPFLIAQAIESRTNSLVVKPCLPEDLLQDVRELLACPPEIRESLRQVRIRSHRGLCQNTRTALLKSGWTIALRVTSFDTPQM